MRAFGCSLFCVMVTLSYGQSNFTGGNPCTIRIQTESVERSFRSNDVAVRLNRSLTQFEFRIPIESLVSFNQSDAELRFFRQLIGEKNEIVIIADLPQENNAVLDLSFFKGNSFLQLYSVVDMGARQFVTDMYLNGMAVNDYQGMIFNFTLCLDTSVLEQPIFVDSERIVQIEIFGKSGRITGL